VHAKLTKDLFLMKNLFLLFTIFLFFSCEPNVEFTAGTENRLTGIADFGLWSANYVSDEFMLGDCFDSEVCTISKYDDGDTGNERYYIDISSIDYYNDPNNCYSSWDGMQHSLRIITTTDELEDEFQVSSGNSAYVGSEESPIMTIIYNIKRYNATQGDENIEYIGHVGFLDVAELNNDDAFISGSFYGTVYRENEFGGVDSVMLKNIVFNKVNVYNQ